METTISKPALTGTVRAYSGCRMHFKVASQQTNNSLSVVDITMDAGAEPPRHIHYNEDELVFLKEGEVVYFVGDDIIEATAGDVIFMPRNVPHHFSIRTKSVACTLVITPGRFDHFFEAITFPYNGTTPLAIERAPTNEEIGMFVEISEKFGVEFV